MKITYPIAAALPANGATPAGALHKFDYELRMNSELSFKKVGTDIQITGNVQLQIADVVTILDNGGEVEDYLMVVKAQLSSLEAAVPEGMPDRTKPSASGAVPRNFNDWLAPNNVWTNETHFFFLSLTVAGTYMKGSELYSLFQSGLIFDVVMTTNPEFVALQNA